MTAARYYLSAYVSGTGPAALYWPRHDQCVALWRVEDNTIELVRYWELERISGLKHHVWPFFTPEHRDRLFTELLSSEGLTLADVTGVWGLPDLGDSTAIKSLAKQYKVSVHSLGHLFGSLFLDARTFREETIIALAIDGGPDFVLEDRVPGYWYSGAVVRGGELQVRPVQSPGLIYTAATMVLGQEPGTLMAATSVCACDADLAALSEGAIADLTFYGGRDGGWATATSLVMNAVDEGRRLLADGVLGRCGEHRLEPAEHIRTVVMRRIQEIAEEIAVQNIRELAEEFGIDTRTAYLGMSGGSALNCPTNSRLLEEFGFRGLLCPPCANDGGQALGLGLAGFYADGVLPGAEFAFTSPYLGSADLGLDEALQSYEAAVAAIAPFDAERFVDDIEAAPVAWVDGAAEVGPRALGHRSLLADPRHAAAKDELNRIKDRQWWRPVAPIVCEDDVADWFDGGRRSPYMLEVFTVAETKRAQVPAIVHLDGTARLQSISRSDDARLFAAVRAFAERTGVPMLCNTSLNAKGEPIVQTAAEAFEFCLAKGVRVLYVDGRRIEFVDEPGIKPLPVPRPRRGEFFDGQETDRDVIWKSLQERGIGVEIMAVVARAPQLVRALDRPSSLRKLQALANQTISTDPAWRAYVEHLESSYGPGGSFESAFTEGGTAEEVLLPLVSDLMQQRGEETGD